MVKLVHVCLFFSVIFGCQAPSGGGGQSGQISSRLFVFSVIF